MREAVKARDKLRLSTIQLMRNAISNAEIEKGKDLDDPDVIQVLSKLSKQYQDSIEAYQKGNRPDLEEKEKTELCTVQEFLPRPMSPEDITGMVKNAIEQVGAKGLKDMGKVMQAVK